MIEALLWVGFALVVVGLVAIYFGVNLGNWVARAGGGCILVAVLVWLFLFLIGHIHGPVNLGAVWGGAMDLPA